MAARKIFISYARQDKEFLNSLVSQFSPFTKTDSVDLWWDEKIELGSRWESDISRKIEESDIFIMLISSNYIESDYCFDKEARHAYQLYLQDRTTIIPIYVSPVSIENLWIGDLNVFPSLSNPLANSPEKEEFLKKLCRKLARTGMAPRYEAQMPHTAPAVTPRLQLDHRALPSVLDRYDTMLETFFAGLQDLECPKYSRKKAIRQIFLNAVKRAVDADAILLHKDREQKDSNTKTTPGMTRLTALFEQITRENPEILQDSFGRQFTIPGASEGNTCSAIPLDSDQDLGLLIVQGSNSAGQRIDEVMQLVLAQASRLSNGFSRRCSLTTLKKSILDLLKKRYGHVSHKMYQTRLALFLDEIRTIRMEFEPIFGFDNTAQTTEIYGWEALARVGTATSAPMDILDTAETWGSEFRIALDTHVLELSIRSYQKQLPTLDGYPHAQTPFLSINIYPDSLFQQSYHTMLKHLILEERLIKGRELILEISEKSIIDETDDSGRGETVQAFLEHMDELRASCKIRFAIDDYGAGHSSLIRLDRLKPELVKVDREMLHCNPKFAKTQIRNLLTERTDWGNSAFMVIIEGLDSLSNIKLKELVRELGVEFIQGHMLGKSRSEIISAPSEEQIASLGKDIGWC